MFAQLQQCGPAPAITGITQWLNTPDGKPIDLASLRGKVVLIDFWAYSCINCQRAIPHVVDWYNRYRGDGFVAIGVHTPEYAFEHVPGNVASGAAGLHIDYPIALDNDYKTWNNYQNLYWPAEYLIDANGTVRHTKFGEGDYDDNREADPPVAHRREPGRPAARPGQLGRHHSADQAHPRDLPESRPGRKLRRHRRISRPASRRSPIPPQLADDRFALRGRWTLDDQGATARQRRRRDRAELHREGRLRRRRRYRHSHRDPGRKTTTTPISGPPTLHQIVGGGADDTAHRDRLDMQVSKGLQVFSFTFG